MGLQKFDLPTSGASGKADVEDKKGQWQVTFAGGLGVFNIEKADARPWLVRKGTYNITLDVDNQVMKSCRPFGLTVAYGKFDRFFAKEGEPPTPKIVNEKIITKGDKRFIVPEHTEFSAVFKIKLPIEYNDFELTWMYIPYLFVVKGSEVGYQQIRDGKNYVGVKPFETFLHSVGYDMLFDSLTPSDNVLPELQQQLNAKDFWYRFRLDENGYLDKVGGVEPATSETDLEYIEFKLKK